MIGKLIFIPFQYRFRMGKRIRLIQNSLKEVDSVCVIIKERLDVIGVPSPPTIL